MTRPDITPSLVGAFLKRRGWKERNAEGEDNVRIYSRESDVSNDPYEILLPLNDEALDSEERVTSAIRMLAAIRNESTRDIVRRILEERYASLNPKENGRKLILFTWGTVFYTFLGFLLFCYLNRANAVRLLPMGAIYALSSLAVGAMVGFFLGIPKIVAPQSDLNEGPTATRAIISTNLEQVSDWLTKILIAIGLIELKEIPSGLMRLAAAFSRAVVASNSSASDEQFWTNVGLAIVICFGIVGFFAAYVATRIWSGRRFLSSIEADDYVQTRMLP